MKNYKITLITSVILLVLFGAVLFIFNRQGYLSFKGEEKTIINNVDGTNLDKNTGNYIDLSKLSEFKNYDGTYGTMESLRFIPEDHAYDYNVSLSLDGKVSLHDFNNGNSYAINVNNIVQISSSDAENCYLLDGNGQVYVYELANVTKSNYSATKLDNVVGIVKLISINYGPIENAGGASATIGIKADGSYVSLNGFRG